MCEDIVGQNADVAKNLSKVYHSGILFQFENEYADSFKALIEEECTMLCISAGIPRPNHKNRNERTRKIVIMFQNWQNAVAELANAFVKDKLYDITSTNLENFGLFYYKAVYEGYADNRNLPYDRINTAFTHQPNIGDFIRSEKAREKLELQQRDDVVREIACEEQ